MKPDRVFSLRLKIIVIGVLPILAFIIINILSTSYSIPNRLLEDKKNETEKLVHTGLSILWYYYGLEETGGYGRERAQLEAKEAIRAIRTGEGIQDYFWIHDFHPRMVIHPNRPELEGEDLSTFEDAQGFKLFLEMVKLVKDSKSTFIRYYWEYHTINGILIEPKLSYVAAFEPWEWIIGTGMNLNEIEAMVISLRQRSLMVVILVSFISLGAVVLLANFIVKPFLSS